LTGIDVVGAHEHFMAAAETLGIAQQARADVLAIGTKQRGAVSDILIRHCTLELPAREVQRAQ
jgi:hypothetical protein